MGNLTTAGTTSYPSGLDTRTAVSDDPNGTEIVASHHNGVALAVIAVETELGTDPAGSMTDVKTRLAVALNDDGTVKTGVIQAGTGSSVGYSSGVFTITYSADAAQANQNVGMSSSVAGNALTVNIMDKSGGTPSASSSPLISFRSTTITQGTYNTRSVIVSTSVVLPASGTLAFTNGEAGRIYLYAIDASGTVEAALCRQGDLDESQLHTTVAISATSNLRTYLYSTTARTNVPIRKVGFLEITTGSTAGNWSNAPSRLQLHGHGVHGTGDIVNTYVSTTASFQSGTRETPADATIPQAIEGDAYFVLPVSFSSAINRVVYDGVVQVNNGTGGYVTVALHRPQIADAFYAMLMNVGAAETRAIPFIFQSLTGVVNSTTITLRMGNNGASTTSLNSETTGGSLYGGGVCHSMLRVTEIFA